MSKRFVEFDEFKKELKSLRSEIEDLSSHMDTTIDVVNANADNGERIEKRLNELQESVKKLSTKSQELSYAVAQKDNGAVVALIGILSLAGFCILLAEINDLDRKLNAIKGKAKAQPVKDSPVEVNFREDGTYTSGKEN